MCINLKSVNVTKVSQPTISLSSSYKKKETEQKLSQSKAVKELMLGHSAGIKKHSLNLSFKH